MPPARSAPHQRAAAFRADPEVAEALEAAQVAQLREPTIAAGESLSDLRAERVDVEALAVRGAGHERVDQLAMEHLLGARQQPARR